MKNLSSYISSQTVRSQNTKLFQLDESGWWARGVNQNRFSRLLPIWHGEALLYPPLNGHPTFHPPSRRAFGILRVLSKALKASEKGCRFTIRPSALRDCRFAIQHAARSSGCDVFLDVVSAFLGIGCYYLVQVNNW